MPIYCTKGTTYMYKSDVHTFQLSQVFYHQDRQTARQTDRQTDILFDVYVYIVIHNGLQYKTHDSGYSNKQDK